MNLSGNHSFIPDYNETDYLLEFEAIIGSNFNDTLIGNEFNNTIMGLMGFDFIDG